MARNTFSVLLEKEGMVNRHTKKQVCINFCKFSCSIETNCDMHVTQSQANSSVGLNRRHTIDLRLQALYDRIILFNFHHVHAVTGVARISLFPIVHTVANRVDVINILEGYLSAWWVHLEDRANLGRCSPGLDRAARGVGYGSRGAKHCDAVI